MPISQTHKPSDIEKRLGAIRSQLYGKEVHYTPVGNPTTTHNPHLLHEQQLVQKDLLKTTVLAVILITVQVVLYFGMNH